MTDLEEKAEEILHKDCPCKAPPDWQGCFHCSAKAIEQALREQILECAERVRQMQVVEQPGIEDSYLKAEDKIINVVVESLVKQLRKMSSEGE